MSDSFIEPSIVTEKNNVKKQKSNGIKIAKNKRMLQKLHIFCFLRYYLLAESSVCEYHSANWDFNFLGRIQ